MLRVRRLAGPVVASLTLLAAGACSLGLDESLIDRMADAGTTVEAGSIDATTPDADVPDAAVPATSCTSDAECTSTDPCLQGHCEIARGVCLYDVCRPAACTSATCTPGVGCTDPQPHGLQASKFDVGAPVLSADVVAALHPYVFLGTAAGLVVFDVSNPAAAPRKVPVLGLAFVPSSFALSGHRLFLVGTVVGGTSGIGSRLPIAWLDVPALPGAASMTAASALATYGRSETPKVLARTDGTAFLVGPNTSSFATARLEAPFVEPVELTPYPAGFGGGFQLAGSSGDRVIALSTQLNDQRLAVVADAGAPGSKSKETQLDSGVVGQNSTFGPYADGALAWASASLGAPSPGASVRAVQFGLPVTSATTDPSPGPYVDVEVFASPPGFAADVVAPLAFVDATHVMTVAAAAEGITQTSVKFVDRSSFSLVKKASGVGDRRAVIPLPPSTVVGAAGSNGVGYVVVSEPANADAGKAASTSVYVFDSACD